MVSRHKITQFYTAPTAVRALMKFGTECVKKHDRSSLRVLGTVGEPINPEAWKWYFEEVGDSQCTIVDTFWQTETGGHMLTGLPGCTPMKPGAASLPFFGVKPAVIDSQVRQRARCAGALRPRAARAARFWHRLPRWASACAPQSSVRAYPVCVRARARAHGSTAGRAGRRVLRARFRAQSVAWLALPPHRPARARGRGLSTVGPRVPAASPRARARPPRARPEQSGNEISGNSVEGVLAIAQPWPGMARSVYGDHKRYMETYLKPYANFYFTGDGALARARAARPRARAPRLPPRAGRAGRARRAAPRM